VQEVFNRRRYPRAQFEGTLIVHDNKTIFRGQSFQISAGGVGLLIPSQALLPGQTLLLHFHPSIDVPAFNAVVSVVSKCNPSNDQEMTPHRYGVKFTSISQNIKEQIYSYTSRKMEAA
jgi:c-di-GMP-binding flagellar brake protein YcgR